MTKLLSVWGLVDVGEPLADAREWLTPADRAAAEVAWNAPPGLGVRRPGVSRPPIPPLPAEHIPLMDEIASMINAELAAERSSERADARLIWCAVVTGEASMRLVAGIARACDALVAGGAPADHPNIKKLRAIRIDPGSSLRGHSPPASFWLLP